MKTSNLFFSIVTIIFFGTSCTNSNISDELAKVKTQLKLEQERLENNKLIVKKAHDLVWSKGKFELIDSLYSDDYIAHWVMGGDTDLKAFKTMLVETRNAFPDLEEKIVHIIAEGDLVVTHFESSGTLTGSLNGIEPTGKKGSRPEIAVHRIENGKIAEQWTVADLMTLLNQLEIDY